MIVRALDANGDWTYGKGFNDYKSGQAAIMQSIQTRLNSFLGNCFFATNAGIDWFNLLGNKNQIALNLAVSATILNTENVTGINQLNIVLSSTRRITITYTANTVLGIVNSINTFTPSDYLLTEGGDILTDESGNPIIV